MWQVIPNHSVCTLDMYVTFTLHYSISNVIIRVFITLVVSTIHTQIITILKEDLRDIICSLYQIFEVPIFAD